MHNLFYNMAEASIEQLSPYLNPDYWDGHSLGYGEATGEWPSYPLFGRELRESKQSLQERIAHMWKAVPVETYREGEIFDAAGYDNGTLVIYREESLTGSPDEVEGEAETLIGRSFPSRPLDTSPSFGRESTSKTVTDDGGRIRYFSNARWGIVGNSKKAEKELHTISTGMVFRVNSDRIAIGLPSLRAQQTPIKIGEANHHIGKTSERLQRINILDVVAYGEAEKKKRSLGSLVAKLALGHSS